MPSATVSLKRANRDKSRFAQLFRSSGGAVALTLSEGAWTALGRPDELHLHLEPVDAPAPPEPPTEVEEEDFAEPGDGDLTALDPWRSPECV